MTELTLIFATAALVLSLVAIHRYNSYHKGLNELVQRMDKASNLYLTVEQAVTKLEVQDEQLSKKVTEGVEIINTMKKDLDVIQRTTNGLVAKVR